MTRTTRCSTVGTNHFRGRKSNFSVTALKKSLRSGVINELLFVNSETRNRKLWTSCNLLRRCAHLIRSMIASGPFLTSHVLKLEQKAKWNTAVWLGERETRTNICLPTCVIRRKSSWVRCNASLICFTILIYIVLVRYGKFSAPALFVQTHHRLGQSEHGCCFLLRVVSSLDVLGCHTVTLSTRRIVLASPNVVAASSCASYPCSIRFGVRL